MPIIVLNNKKKTLSIFSLKTYFHLTNNNNSK